MSGVDSGDRHIRKGAADAVRRWVEEHFDAHRNARRLLSEFVRVIATAPSAPADQAPA